MIEIWSHSLTTGKGIPVPRETFYLNNLNQNKMNKQQFIDKTPENDLETIAQIILTRFSKTKIEQIRRVLGEITAICPKTWMKETPLNTYLHAIQKCQELNKSDEETL